MSSYMGDDLEKELQDTKDAADKTKDAARKTKNAAKTIKNLKNGHKAAKTAGKATKAAAKGAAAAGKAVAFFTTPMGLGVLIAIILSVIILVVGSLIVAAPSVIWNEMTHTDEHLDPGKSIEKELQIDDNTMKEREQEWADIVNEEIDGSHEDMMDEIKKHCKANGVDYEATKENIVDSTDFLGSQETEDKSDAYQNEQKFYQIFKDKGYSEIASITMVSAMDYLTEVDPSYNLLADEAFDNVKLTGKKKSFKSHKYLNAFGEPKVGVLKFNKSDFVAYVRTAYGKKKGKGKNQQMTIPLKTLKAKIRLIKPSDPLKYYIEDLEGSNYFTLCIVALEDVIVNLSWNNGKILIDETNDYIYGTVENIGKSISKAVTKTIKPGVIVKIVFFKKILTDNYSCDFISSNGTISIAITE